MSTLIEYAKSEMNIAWPKSDEMQDMVKKNILELIEVFSNQGHSCFSASYILAHFNSLANFHPITPLTGSDNEWKKAGGESYQNKRCPEVFKNSKDGTPFTIRGKIFEDEKGSRFSCSESHVSIEFPWTYKEPEIIKVDNERNIIEPFNAKVWKLECAMHLMDHYDLDKDEAIEYADACFESCDPEIDDPIDTADEEMHAAAN